MLMMHKPKCQNNDITAIKTSSKSHLPWEELFHKTLLFFRMYADFEAEN